MYLKARLISGEVYKIMVKLVLHPTAEEIVQAGDVEAVLLVNPT